MTIPTQVKIGAVTYQVKILSDWPGGGDWDGEMFYDRDHGHAIYIKANLTPEAQYVTFIHEVLHALNSTMDHEFLDSLSEQLFQVLAENHLLRL